MDFSNIDWVKVLATLSSILLAISEFLASNKKVKSNSVSQLIKNVIKKD